MKQIFTPYPITKILLCIFVWAISFMLPFSLFAYDVTPLTYGSLEDVIDADGTGSERVCAFIDNGPGNNNISAPSQFGPMTIADFVNQVNDETFIAMETDFVVIFFSESPSCNNIDDARGETSFLDEFLVVFEAGPEPIMGCTDPDASNWNSEAEEDDASCEYLNLTAIGINGLHSETFMSLFFVLSLSTTAYFLTAGFSHLFSRKKK